MQDVIRYAIYGTLIGVVGTGLGGMLAFFTEKKGQRFLAGVLEFAAGLMLSVVLMDLLPHAFAGATLFQVLVGVLCGLWLMFLTEGMLEKRQNKLNALPKNQRDLRRMGLAMTLGIAMHNLPEGLAVGSGFDANYMLGVSLALTILLHDVPEGVAMAVPLKAGGMKPWKAVAIAAATGIPTGVGALLGAAAGQISDQVISFCLALAGGTMLFVVLSDLIPQSKKIYGGRMGSFCNILGVLLGMILSVGLG